MTHLHPQEVSTLATRKTTTKSKTKTSKAKAVEVITLATAKRRKIDFKTGFNPDGKLDPNDARKVLDAAMRSVSGTALRRMRGVRIIIIA